MKCPNCGTVNKNRNVCIKCGKFLQGKKLRQPIDPKVKRQETKKKLFATGKGCLLSGVLVIVALIVITLIFVLLSQLLGRFLDFSQPIVVTDSDGSAVTNADGMPVYETDENGSVIFVEPDWESLAIESSLAAAEAANETSGTTAE